jgi:hypothetical protein
VNAVTNQVFLEALFAEALPGAFTIVCSFPGDPYRADRHAWAGRPWAPRQKLRARFDAGNTYLTVSTFESDPQSGEMRRRKANFVAMHAVMIDDIGTKVHREKLLLAPSAVIETSPANYQAYLFLHQDASTRDRSLCERLIARMIGAGLTADGKDPGMRGVTRYGRLPVGLNGKAKYVQQLGQPFATRCVVFKPQLRYSIAEIACAWRLDLTAPQRAPVIPIIAAQARRASTTFNDLVQTLRLMGMYRGRIGNGPWHDIRCPWVHEHTDAADNGTAISDPSPDNNFAGGFKCHHAHGETLSMRDMWRWVRELARILEEGRQA